MCRKLVRKKKNDVDEEKSVQRSEGLIFILLATKVALVLVHPLQPQISKQQVRWLRQQGVLN